jgi:hypothetical protein
VPIAVADLQLRFGFECGCRSPGHRVVVALELLLRALIAGLGAVGRTDDDQREAGGQRTHRITPRRAFFAERPD